MAAKTSSQGGLGLVPPVWGGEGGGIGSFCLGSHPGRLM